MYQLAVIIPVYNGEKALPKLLASLLPQLTNTIECVFIDDGSQDASYQILCEATANLPTVRVVTQENRGVAATRNRGIELTTSEYIWFVDGDDWLAADAISKVQAQLTNQAAPMIHFNFVDHFLNGSEQVNPYFLNQKDDYCGYEFYQKAVGKFSYELKNMVWSFIFERQFLVVNTITFDETLPIFEDIVFLATCYAQNQPILILNDCLYHYQQHPQSLTHTATHFQEANYRRVVDALEVIANRTPKLANDIIYYALLLMSTVGSAEKTKLYQQVLQKNNYQFYAKYPQLYSIVWQLKKLVNRIVRKVFKLPMFWR